MVGQGGVVECDIKRRPVDPRACSPPHWVRGGWGPARDRPGRAYWVIQDASQTVIPLKGIRVGKALYPFLVSFIRLHGPHRYSVSSIVPRVCTCGGASTCGGGRAHPRPEFFSGKYRRGRFRVQCLSQTRISRKSIQNLRARAARRSFIEICGLW